MKSKIIIFTAVAALFLKGCTGLMPYKTEFDCEKEPGGHCGGLTENIKEAYEIAGVTNNKECEEGDVNYEINELTFQIVKPGLTPVKGIPKNKRTKKKVCKQKCKYVYK